MSALRYKVVEVATVTDADLEATINHWIARGWLFDDIRFVMKDGSKRPAMAFVMFTRTTPEETPS